MQTHGALRLYGPHHQRVRILFVFLIASAVVRERLARLAVENTIRGSCGSIANIFIWRDREIEYSLPALSRDC